MNTNNAALVLHPLEVARGTDVALLAKPRVVRAKLRERLIFNFALPPAALATRLPVPWLTPLVVRDQAVASFCLLRLRQVVLGRVPNFLGPSITSCAWRFGVNDAREGTPRAAVWVTKRYNATWMGRLLPLLGYSWSSCRVRVQLGPDGSGGRRLLVSDGPDRIFAARLCDGGQATNSRLFDSSEAFAGFIKDGVSSFSPSHRGSELAYVDLIKGDQTYTALTFDEVEAPLIEEWTGAAADRCLDSAFRTEGSTYEWRYRGRLAT